MKRALLALLAAASLALVAEEPKAKPGPAAPAAKSAPAAAKPAAPAAIVANKDSKTYHKADCKAAGKIKDANKTSFASAAEADKAGYKACKTCKP